MFLIILTLFSFFFFTKNINIVHSEQDETSPDVIVIRVMDNPSHISPLVWYRSNIINQGNPQSLKVDGYEAVKDGRSVYINAPVIKTETNGDKTINSYIFIISYNNNADNNTVTIFNQVLKYFRFNKELVDSVITSGKTCHLDTGVQCITDEDCTKKNDYCLSDKAKLTRDIKRWSDFMTINGLLSTYKTKYSYYPKLESGSYLASKTISLWPSWSETLAKELDASLPLDPINNFFKCSQDETENKKYDPITCWDEHNKKFSTDMDTKIMPISNNDDSSSRAYFYARLDNARYKLCTNFETWGQYTNLPAVHQCDQNQIIADSSTKPIINLGALRGKPGHLYNGYFNVKTVNNLKLSKIIIEPVNPTNWSNWTNWNFTPNTGLKVEEIQNNQFKIIAKKAGKNGTYRIKITVEDNLGATSSIEGDIYICDQKEPENNKCGTVPDGCGGYIQYDKCPTGSECIDNNCFSCFTCQKNTTQAIPSSCNEYQLCNEYNTSGCTRWEKATCPYSTYINPTGGNSLCVNCRQCNLGAKECASATSYKTCVMSSNCAQNGCTEFVTTECPHNPTGGQKTCSNGICVDAQSCRDCEPSSYIATCLDGTHYSTCETYGDNCTRVSSVACPTNTECTGNGQCSAVPNCRECEPNIYTRTCSDSTHYLFCEVYNTNCTRVKSAACASGQECSNGQCINLGVCDTNPASWGNYGTGAGSFTKYLGQTNGLFMVALKAPIGSTIKVTYGGAIIFQCTAAVQTGGNGCASTVQFNYVSGAGSAIVNITTPAPNVDWETIITCPQ